MALNMVKLNRHRDKLDHQNWMGQIKDWHERLNFLIFQGNSQLVLLLLLAHGYHIIHLEGAMDLHINIPNLISKLFPFIILVFQAKHLFLSLAKFFLKVKIKENSLLFLAYSYLFLLCSNYPFNLFIYIFHLTNKMR